MEHPKIRSGATIYRDPWGIPHIRGDEYYDVFFAQGFATAQDRLWQMDFDRLRCLGRAAEYVGASSMEEDKLMRRRDFERVSRADYSICSDAAKSALDAYADGVNAFIESDDSLPYEYHLLGAEPELWEPWHCIVVYKVRNSAEGSFQSKLWRTELAAKLGPERAAELSPGYQRGMYMTVPPGKTYDGPAQNAIEELRRAVNATAPLREVDGGSNGWAVSGSLTKSGIPMVGGDSHRALEVPNVYYQVHLASRDFDVLGHSIPGMPLVMHFAHNRHVAWGMTHGGVDTQDLFLEQLRRNDGKVEYLFRDEWLPAQEKTELLEARGSEAVKIEALRTHHGPIISGSADSGWGIALADPGSEDATPWVDATLDAMRATNADEFESALAGWTDRVNNYPYADVHGNFGYALKGRIPIRGEVNGWGPVAGWTGENEWQGFIPDEELPRSRNPEVEWAVTCNQRVVGDDYAYFLTATFGPDYRARRIITHIEKAKAGSRKIELIDMAAFHADAVSLPARVILERIRELDSPSDALPYVSEAVEALSSWNGSLDSDSVAAAIYSELSDEISLALIERCYGIDRKEFEADPDLSAFDHLRRNVAPAFIASLERGGSETFLNDGESLDEFLLGAVSAAAETLVEKHGSLAAKTWGEMHFTSQIHPLSQQFPDHAAHLNAPSVGTGGGGDVPFATGSRPMLDHKTGSGSVNRYLHDPSNWRDGKWIVPLGVSGNSSARHFSDQQDMWGRVESIPQLFEWDEILSSAESSQQVRGVRE